ncbi:MAG: 2-oxoacid:acceptor oxidoreductase family protein [Oscillospiraceae bacterium]|nr:2-oxoacid:acceptor oxidoreductase family protein [Oscillospiraceae bacterium]
MTHSIIIAGFGGQGILFTGELIAYAAMNEGKNVTWFPSYGPEMRGGTCNCHVTVSDTPIGTPKVEQADTAIIFNLQALDKFESKVKPGGTIILDSSNVKRKVERTDINVIYMNAADEAEKIGERLLAGMVMLGRFQQHTKIVELDSLIGGMNERVSANRAHLKAINEKMIRRGTMIN